MNNLNFISIKCGRFLKLTFITGTFVFILATLQSCGPELKASADWAKNKEGGASSVTQLEKTLFNVGIFADEMMTGIKYGSLDKADAKESNTEFGFYEGLEFIGKGGKYHDGSSITLNYLEVPIYAIARHKLGAGALFGGLGPYFAYGIGGKVKGGGFSESSFGDNNGGYKRFDAGLGFMAEYKLDMGFSLSLDYDLGLTNIAYPSLDITSHNRSFGINVGYDISRFFKKK
jgi:hypothetical protein